MAMEPTRKPDLPILELESLEALQNWLAENYNTSAGVWLAINRKECKTPGIELTDAVDEGLCWGWIDSRPNKWRTDKYLLLFTPRKPTSGWSRVNKEKLMRLESLGRIQPPGWEKINLAKAIGTWEKLDVVEELTTPPDLLAALAQDSQALENYNAFSKSTKRGLLEWLNNAKTAETRNKRIAAILEGAKTKTNPLAYKRT